VCLFTAVPITQSCSRLCHERSSVTQAVGVGPWREKVKHTRVSTNAASARLRLCRRRPELAGRRVSALPGKMTPEVVAGILAAFLRYNRLHLDEAFQILDVDGDGIISQKDLDEATEALDLDVPPQALAAWHRHYNTAGDGQMTPKEWRAALDAADAAGVLLSCGMIEDGNEGGEEMEREEERGFDAARGRGAETPVEERKSFAAQRGGVSLNPVAHDGLVVQKHSQAVNSQLSAARRQLVAKGIIAAPYEDSNEEENLPQRVRMERDLRKFAKKEVNPAMSLKVVQGRKMLAESGILDDLLQMRVAKQQRPATAQPRTISAQPVARPASAARRLPSDVVRRREISPLYNQTWQEKHAHDPRFTSKSVQSLTRPLPHRMSLNKAHKANPRNTVRSQIRVASTQAQSDESVYTGHAFAGTQRDIRPASAPPGGLKLDFEALRRFNEAIARGEIQADVTFEVSEMEEESDSGVDPAPSVPQKTSPAKRWGGFSKVEMLTAPEFEHVPISKLMPSLFGDDVVMRPHRGLLELASKKLVESKHVKVCLRLLHAQTARAPEACEVCSFSCL